MRFSSAITAVAGLAAVGVISLVATPAQAQSTITGLFNTGVAANGTTLLSIGDTDTHYQFIDGASVTQAVVSNIQGAPYAVSTDSRYIWQTVGGPPVGTYTLRTTFTLSGSTAGAQITGLFSTDNTGVIRLNGTPVGSASTTFTSFTPFTISSGFVTGTNVLDFVVTNTDGPGALNVSTLRGTFVAANAPEPGSIALALTAGIPVVGIVARRRRKA